MYMFWKPGMDMCVSHVRRRQVPAYVFPDGYRRCRPARPTDMQPPAKRPPSHDVDMNLSGSEDGRSKRKGSHLQVNEQVGSEKKQNISPRRQDLEASVILSSQFHGTLMECVPRVGSADALSNTSTVTSDSDEQTACKDIGVSAAVNHVSGNVRGSKESSSNGSLQVSSNEGEPDIH